MVSEKGVKQSQFVKYLQSIYTKYYYSNRHIFKCIDV